ncbi:MAG: glycosyltransferase family 2 protein [SAR324 cluster bacterium]|uniref:Glycosyltransferase family 2 protein n=1 Tax=SAR324 cluster bacterium TaxID=2024889 RepID=A0A7X9IMI7_9DELT|nr:glycosyltransferase family 2 protein [SAR324 cluster bacterium]
MSKVTLGMSTYDDFDGVYFSCQGNRLLHPILDLDGEIIVIDNNPNSSHGAATKHFCNKSKFIKYIPFTKYQGTAVRSELFNYSKSEIVICIDSHVLLAPGAIDAVVKYLSLEQTDSPILVQGPRLYDNLSHCSLKWLNIWSATMLGKWAPTIPVDTIGNEAFEIENQGLGAFACRRKEWLGLNPLFRGFGGEEGYIQRKYQLAGGKVVCIPEFKWIHRFDRPNGIPYRCNLKDRLFNYFLGAFELKLSTDSIVENFRALLSDFHVRAIFKEALKAYNKSKTDSSLKLDNSGEN